MRNSLSGLLLLTIALCLLVTGCESLNTTGGVDPSITVTSSSSASTSDSDLIGVWEPLDAMHESLIEFDSDGLMTWTSLDTGEVEDRLSYRVEGDSIIILGSEGEERISYSVDDDVLTLSYPDGFGETFQRRTAGGLSTIPTDSSTSQGDALTGVWLCRGHAAGSWLIVYPDGTMTWPTDIEEWEETGGDEYDYRVDGDSLIVTDWEGNSETWDYYLEPAGADLGEVLELSLPETGSPSGDVYTFERQPLDVLLLGPWHSLEEGELVYFLIDGQMSAYEVDSENELQVPYAVDDGDLVLTDVYSGATMSFPYSITGQSTDDRFDDVLEITDTDTGEVSSYERYSP